MAFSAETAKYSFSTLNAESRLRLCSRLFASLETVEARETEIHLLLNSLDLNHLLTQVL